MTKKESSAEETSSMEEPSNLPTNNSAIRFSTNNKEQKLNKDNYESLPATSSVSAHMLAGAAAGTMEHALMYPVDTIKTRMQSLAPHIRANYRNVADAFFQIRKQEGLKSTGRGISAVALGAGPAHAMYFAVYEKSKKTSGDKRADRSCGSHYFRCCSNTVP